MSQLAVHVTVPAQGRDLIAPAGLAAPEGSTTVARVRGGHVTRLREAATGQPILHVTDTAETVQIVWPVDPRPGAFPEAMFRPTPSRFTRAADALLAEAAATAPDAMPEERARAIACATAERFTYGHPSARFTDGLDHVPALGCGLAEGSCVDINTYFLASLRAAGIEAGYVVGAFFPAEKGDHCEDMHCWVVTRIEGVLAAWDIAHHLKMGTREIAPALNPKPGRRVALGHSMGLSLPELGVHDLKLLSEPLAVIGSDVVLIDGLTITLAPMASDAVV